MPSAYETTTINLALSVLRAVLPNCARHNVGTKEVRLALRVIRPHIRDSPAPAEFWRHASSDAAHPWESGHTPYHRIVLDLKAVGFRIDAENLP